MAYIYQLSFEITPQQASTLHLGESLERVLGYLRTLLPSEDGYVTSRAAYSCCPPDQPVGIVFESEWERWDDLEDHRTKGLEEKKVLEEFSPEVLAGGVKIQILREVD